MWTVGEEIDEFGDPNTLPWATDRDEIMIVNGDVGIKMSFDKWYEFGVALRACLESTKIGLEKAENVVEDVVWK